jgi:hypothetical protein
MSRRADAASETTGYLGLAVSDDPSGAGPASMARLHATALAELEQHVDRHGSCLECGDPWPCEVACLAAFTLEAVDR